MKNHLRMFGIVLAASLFGVIANLAAAEQPSDWQGGIGPGMMGGYGPGYGMGQGMMGNYGHGCDIGPGMRGGYGMGHGMMGESFRELGLSDEQNSKVTKIRQEMRTKQWAVMGQIMDAQDRLQELYDADNQDAAAINQQYKVIEGLRSQMVDNSVDAHNRINSILTKEQREKFREWGHGYGTMMR